jgi:CDP-diacylglycerol--serine O-phosphatidyltransferase
MLKRTIFLMFVYEIQYNHVNLCKMHPMVSKSIIVRHIPNAITCCNLLCGCFSLLAAFNGQVKTACYFIFLATVFDFFDGFAARWLKAHSDIGKELDSLADMVSFGVAPASILFVLLLSTVSGQGFSTAMYACGWWMALPAYLIAVFSALRLAKFNIDVRQTDSFIGLPTPACALFICSLAFTQGKFALLTGNLYFLLILIGALSYLLVAELPLFSLKFKSFGWKKNKIRYIFLAVSALLLAVFHGAGLMLVIFLYLLLSVLVRTLCKQKSQNDCSRM